MSASGEEFSAEEELSLEEKLEALPPHLESEGSRARAYLHIGRMSHGKWRLSYVTNSGREVLYLEEDSLPTLAEGALEELEENGFL